MKIRKACAFLVIGCAFLSGCERAPAVRTNPTEIKGGCAYLEGTLKSVDQHNDRVDITFDDGRIVRLRVPYGTPTIFRPGYYNRIYIQDKSDLIALVDYDEPKFLVVFDKSKDDKKKDDKKGSL